MRTQVANDMIIAEDDAGSLLEDPQSNALKTNQSTSGCAIHIDLAPVRCNLR